MRQHRVFFTLALFLGLAMGAAACDSPAKKTGKIFFDRDTCVMETTPFVWEGKMLLFASVRRGGAEHTPAQLSLQITDPESGEVLCTFGTGCSLGCAFVNQGTLHVFAARQPEGESWFRDIVHFCSSDLKTWREIPAVAAENENLLNSSVCRDGDGFLMAYESNNPIGFCFKFARSADLEHWEKVPDTYYAGPDGKTYSACPVIRRSGDYYYVIYLRQDGRGGYESAMIRSKDLRAWEESPVNPILAACEGEGINNSDVDLCEAGGKTILVYAVGDQSSWCDVREAVFDGAIDRFFAACYPEEADTDSEQ